MNKFYSTIMMLAMMFAALSFTACSGDDEDEDNGGSLIIDGVAYYYEATITKSYYGGLYLSINARKSRVNFGPDKILKIYLYGHSKVSDLKKGETYDYEDIEIENIENGYVIALYEKDYETIGGSITILSVDKYKVSMKFNDLKFKLAYSSNIFGEDYEPSNPTIHNVKGTAIFTSGAIDSNGNDVPFD